MLSGFKSRWITSCECKYDNAAAIPYIIINFGVSIKVEFPLAFSFKIKCDNAPFLANSVTITGLDFFLKLFGLNPINFKTDRWSNLDIMLT